jgi:hypothetical protein
VSTIDRVFLIMSFLSLLGLMDLDSGQLTIDN